MGVREASSSHVKPPQRLSLGQILFLLLVFEALAGASIVAYELVNYRERLLLHRLMATDSTQAARNVQRSIDDYLWHLVRLRDYWANPNHGPKQCIEMAERMREEHPAFVLLAGLDGEDVCRWSSAETWMGQLEGMDLKKSSPWISVMGRARRGERFAVTQLPASGETSLAVASATAGGGGKRAVLGGIDLDTVLVMAIDESDRKVLNVEVVDRNASRLVLGPHEGGPTEPVETRPLKVGSHAMQLRFWAPQGAAVARTARLAPWALWGGGAIAVAATIILWQYLRYRRRELVQTGSYLAALESLNEISTAISAALGSGRQVLDQLAQLAMQLLNMARSGVGLLDERTGTLRIFAFAGEVPPHPQDTFVVGADMPATRRCLEEGEIVFEEDVQRPRKALNTRITDQFGAGSFVLIPLRVEGRSIGLMALSDTQPRRFTPAERRLAQFLGSQAAVILANSRLYKRIRRSLDEQKHLRRQQEKLYAANAAVYQASTFEKSVHALTERGQEALGVDLCAINLINDDRTEATVVAANGEGAEMLRGKCFPLAGTYSDEAIQTGWMVVHERMEDDGRARPSFAARLNIGSMINLPMYRSDGRPLAVLVLVRREPSRFGREYRRLCEVFASRAAAAIENAQLNEQTRDDAEAKAVLLRELHHRVKNNLAGIVGLLSMNDQELSPAARQWLDRVVARIQAMARAHDLFGGGVHRVALDRLVAEVLPSLSVIKPAGVQVKLDVRDGDVELDTPQAVSLAMALHELCTNAIQHGLCSRGKLLIRSRRTEQGVAVDVCDDGQHAGDPLGCAGADPQRSTASGNGGGGAGLKLVRELVARELRGSFRLCARPEGGTVATVEFPVAAAHSGGGM